MDGYDIIGDIHGCATKLETLLAALGYQCDGAGGAYRHPDRQAIFVGDLIDRGKEQLRVLQIVKAMTDAGSAQIVMGNHEFNALCYATEHPDGSGRHLRERNEKNTEQHEEFLNQLTAEQRAHYLDWFQSFPLWLDLGGLRVVHACWHEESMAVVKDELEDVRFTTREQLVAASDKTHRLYKAIEVLLKGPEISLIAHGQSAYLDTDGHERKRARIRWWNDDAATLRDIAVMEGKFTTASGELYPELPNEPVKPDARSYVYTGAVPVFFGHYWRTGKPTPTRDWSTRSACVDFSAVNDGRLTAYRWSGEDQIRADHFFPAGG